jgi:hypothetical protein
MVRYSPFAIRFPRKTNEFIRAGAEQVVSGRGKEEGLAGFLRQIHCFRVHCHRMKNITLSAEEELIERARLIARSQHKTLNAAFREWLRTFAAQSGDEQEFDRLMRRLRHINAGGPFTRDEMNER